MSMSCIVFFSVWLPRLRCVGLPIDRSFECFLIEPNYKTRDFISKDTKNLYKLLNIDSHMHCFGDAYVKNGSFLNKIF